MNHTETDNTEKYEGFTVGLALLDALPVLFFLFTGVVIYMLWGSRLFLAGVAAATIGGASKVLWKLIVAANGKDVEGLTKAFRVLMPAGFTMMLLSLVTGIVSDLISGDGSSGSRTLSGLLQGITMMPAAVFFAAGICGLCLMGWLGRHMDNSARSNWIEEITNCLAQLAILIGVIIVYFGMCYHAEAFAFDALTSTGSVTVTETEQMYFFDGPGTDTAIIFYPGAKVEPEAYAPLMQMIAEGGVDCCLCSMPLNFALFDKGLADEIRAEIEGDNAPYAGPDNDYKKWYLCGHSLGGIAASMLAAEDKSYDWAGIIFLASYPEVGVEIPALSIYGTEDKVLASSDYSKAEIKGYWPEIFTEKVIQGGNHAQFGSYGSQNGDGQASITAAEQQKQTSDEIIRWIEDQ